MTPGPPILSRGDDRRAFAPAAVLALAFLVAALVDAWAAGAAAHEPSTLLALGLFVSRFGLSGYMLLVSGLSTVGAALLLRWTDRPAVAARARRLVERAAFFFAAIAASGLVCQALKHLVGRARPRFRDSLGAFHFAGPTFCSGFESFPSGHSTTALAAATAVTLLRPGWGVIAFPAALLICASRVVAEAHYPSDTLAGALLGTLVAFRVAEVFAARDIAFTVADPLPRLRIRRTGLTAQERDARAL